MKALIIGEKVSASVMDFIHGGGHYTRRIFVPVGVGLVFGINEGEAYAFAGYDPDTFHPDIIAEVDIPDGLMSKVINLIIARAELTNEVTTIESILESK